jgi:hypothetical protein
VPQHAFDPQAFAFREAGAEDWVSDDELRQMAQAGELVVTTDRQIVTVDEWESRNWDAGRHPDGPKTLEEAKEALRARARDPHSPDWDSTVYDDLEPR